MWVTSEPGQVSFLLNSPPKKYLQHLRLNLGHRSLCTSTRLRCTDGISTSLDERNNQRNHIRGPSEKEKRDDRLNLTASFRAIKCSIGNLIVECVILQQLVSPYQYPDLDGGIRTSSLQSLQCNRAASAIPAVSIQMAFSASRTTISMGCPDHSTLNEAMIR